MPTSTAAQKAAAALAGSTYDPTKFGETGGWYNVKETAKRNAVEPAPTGDGGGGGGGGGGGYKPVDLTDGKNAADQWNLENDPIYRMAMLQGQSSFNIARANALAAMQNQTTGLNRQQANIENSAIGSRRQLAGNFAARGMQRGSYGAYYRAQDQMNAEQIAKTTDIRDQIAALSQDYLGKFGATGTDWTATGVGQDYRNQAIQQALNAQIARYGTI